MATKRKKTAKRTTTETEAQKAMRLLKQERDDAVERYNDLRASFRTLLRECREAQQREEETLNQLAVVQGMLHAERQAKPATVQEQLVNKFIATTGVPMPDPMTAVEPDSDMEVDEVAALAAMSVPLPVAPVDEEPDFQPKYHEGLTDGFLAGKTE